MDIEIKGAIISDSEQWIYDYFEIPATSASKVNKLMSKAKKGDEITLLVNSPGGMVHAGSEIFSILKSYEGPTKSKILGLAGSAASVIIAGTDVVEISPAGQIMIHNASCGAYGDYNKMDMTSEMLKSVNESVAHAYMTKTGMNKKELLELMNKTTWMTAEKAVQLGFADKVMFTEEVNITNTLISNGLLPKSVIDKVRAEFKGKELSNLEGKERLILAKSKLNLVMNI